MKNIHVYDTAALILEGGGMRGLYTAGVLDAFLDEGIMFKKGIGVSMGMCNACSYFAMQRDRAAKVIIDYIGRKDYSGLRNIIKYGDFFNIGLIYHDIPEKLYRLDNEAFKELNPELYSCVTNVKTGKPEYIQVKDMFDDIELIRASATLPLMGKPVEYKGEKYLDGGVSDSIPIKKSEEMGNSKNVIILTQPRDYRKEKSSAYPLIKAVFHNHKQFAENMRVRHEVYNSTLEYIAKREKEGDVFVIAPDSSLDIARIEYDTGKLTKVYERGYNEALKYIPALKKFLEENK